MFLRCLLFVTVFGLFWLSRQSECQTFRTVTFSADRPSFSVTWKPGNQILDMIPCKPILFFYLNILASQNWILIYWYGRCTQVRERLLMRNFWYILIGEYSVEMKQMSQIHAIYPRSCSKWDFIFSLTIVARFVCFSV